MDAAKVGRSIAFLRKRYRMTQRQLADCLQISDKAISKWERGLSVPDVSLLSKLSVILDTDIESLLEGNIASFDVRWNGVLELHYPDGIDASTLLYDKPVGYFQLSYFLLAGITDIYVTGSASESKWLKEHLGNGEKVGISLEYENKNNAGKNVDGTMVVSGLSFLYGKDLTKSFRRILYGSAMSCELKNYQGEALNIRFERMRIKQKAFSELDRGVVAFPITTIDAFYNAASLMKYVQVSMKERIGDLYEIAYHRGLI